MRKRIVLRLSFLALLAFSGLAHLSSVHAASVAYSVTDIGWLVGTGNEKFDVLTKVSACAINNDAVILSNSTTEMGGFFAAPFTSIDGVVKRLGSQKEFTFMVAMNEESDIVGYRTSLDDQSYQSTIPTVWRKRKPIDLPRLSEGEAFAAGINDNGQIVGNAYVSPGGARHAVLWENDTIVDLGALGGTNSFATAINADGVIVGMSDVDDREGTVPFVWRDGEMTEIELPDGMNCSAEMINDTGIIAGNMYDESHKLFGVIWIDGEMEPVPSLVNDGSTFPIDLNENGQMVGWSANAPGDHTTYSAVLWNGSDVFDLNVLIPADTGYRLISGQAINDNRQILATAVASDEHQHGVLLDPGE